MKEENKVEITKTINICNDCPDYVVQHLSEPNDMTNYIPPKALCGQTGEDLRNGHMNWEYFFRIPNTCPRLKKDGKNGKTGIEL